MGQVPIRIRIKEELAREFRGKRRGFAARFVRATIAQDLPGLDKNTFMIQDLQQANDDRKGSLSVDIAPFVKDLDRKVEVLKEQGVTVNNNRANLIRLLVVRAWREHGQRKVN